MVEDEMAGWHPQFNGREFEQTPGDNEGQRRLACCSPWGLRESEVTERLNNSNNTHHTALKNFFVFSPLTNFRLLAIASLSLFTLLHIYIPVGRT